MPPRFKKRYSVSCSSINPQYPGRGSRWYVWVEHWSGWKKIGFAAFMRRTLDPALRTRLMKEAVRKGIPVELLNEVMIEGGPYVV